MLHIQTLEWKNFTVNTRDSGLFENFCKSQSELFIGLGSNTKLEVYYSEQPTQEILDAVQAKWDSIESNSPEALEVVQGQQKEAIQNRIKGMTELCKSIALDFKTGNAQLLLAEPQGTDLIVIKQNIFTVASSVLTALQAEDVDLVYAAIKAIPLESYDAKYITAARLLVFLNQIRVFNGQQPITDIANA